MALNNNNCQQILMKLEEIDFKTPKKIEKYSLKYSPKQLKTEFKCDNFIRRLELNDTDIKVPGIQIRTTRQIQKDEKINSSYVLELFNSIELNRDNQIVNKLLNPTIDDSYNSLITCRCLKSKCRQQYCVCVANNQECSIKCECHNCTNKESKHNKQSIPEFIGCRCKKQACSKKYCECRKKNLRCTTKCSCCDECKNVFVHSTHDHRI